jgi:hypothetical protein
MSPAFAWFFLAMAYQQLDRHDEAEKWFTKANERVEQEMAGNPGNWNRLLTLKLFQAEAKQMLGESKQQ